MSEVAKKIADDLALVLYDKIPACREVDVKLFAEVMEWALPNDAVDGAADRFKIGVVKTLSQYMRPIIDRHLEPLRVENKVLSAYHIISEDKVEKVVDALTLADKLLYGNPCTCCEAIHGMGHKPECPIIRIRKATAILTEVLEAKDG